MTQCVMASFRGLLLLTCLILAAFSSVVVIGMEVCSSSQLPANYSFRRVSESRALKEATFAFINVQAS